MNTKSDIKQSLRLYLIADPEQTSGDFLIAVAEAAGAGVTAVQLRSKELEDGPFLELAHSIKRICEVHAVPIFINDRVDAALAIEADGVHVGVDDLPLPVVRSLVGDRVILGYSPATVEQLAAASAQGADYVGLGPVFGTASKADAGDAIGLEAVHRMTVSRSLPSVGIGGITADNAAKVIEAGADGVAVISAILRSSEPASSASQLRAIVDRALAKRAGGE